ncbi:hypothetical protein G9C85_11050 [Halorubellus sp. JP-L1]|uniref:endo-1,4-beta-xylanase n=1 Tax=Halorubellus sp. JP-L1 TaxID=2715753 RepID=UPI00140A7FAF|nr:endo-1,4-beta-xylanase [Halorubellus sp. JP-L1]NHN42160.1 hypothetical protein [Halorubellus sp. JP-L1]
MTGGSVAQSTPSYYGRARGDPNWRTTAESRIERVRTAPLRVSVTDASGRPIPDAEVDVEMTDHAFGFGTAVSVPKLTSDSTSAQTYRRLLREHFNKTTIENGLKWPAWSGEWGPEFAPEQTIEAIRWLREQRFPVRGHTLVWPSYDNAPAYVEEIGRDDPERLRTEIRDHIRDEAGRLAGLVDEWDVVNEPTTNTAFMEVLGRDAMVEWLQTAREAAPEADLFVNDYAPLQPADSNLPERFEELVEYLVDSGAPLDGIGIEAHFSDDWLLHPAAVVDAFDRLSSFGLELQITEFSFSLEEVTPATRALQAAYTRDLLIAAYSHPAVTTFTFWGFWTERHFSPSAALFGEDWTLRPHGRAFLDLVYDEWWTEATGRTDAGGTFATRGYKGSYLVRASAGQGRALTTTSLSGSGTTVEMTLQ